MLTGLAPLGRSLTLFLLTISTHAASPDGGGVWLPSLSFPELPGKASDLNADAFHSADVLELCSRWIRWTRRGKNAEELNSRP